MCAPFGLKAGELKTNQSAKCFKVNFMSVGDKSHCSKKNLCFDERSQSKR